MAIQEQLESFRQFATRMIGEGSEGSLDDLFELWRSQNISDEELLKSRDALQAACAEMDNPDAWIDADEHLAQIRAKYGFKGNS